jgi:hypothetical protein
MTGGTVETTPPTLTDAVARLSGRRMVTLNRDMQVTAGKVSAVTRELRALGFEVEQLGDSPIAWMPEHLVWIWGNAAWFPNVLASIEALPPERRPATVVWHIEPLPTPRDSGFGVRGWPRPTAREVAKIALRDKRRSDVYTNWWTLRRLARAGIPDVLAVSSGERNEFLAEHGIPSIRVPYGSEPSDGKDLGIERDVDVLLLGVLHLRSRKRALERLRREGIDIVARGSYTDKALWGDARTELVNRAKIMLSVGRFPGTLGAKRFFISMACNSLVLSDPLYDPQPFVPGEHFVMAPFEEFGATIRHYLEHEEERRRIAANGHRLVTTELTFTKSFGRLFTTVAERLG